ncbi:hypothetical protein L7F22_020363 [Adiantum nelumboides]|nr:hypothetical protein [Adiantum nelumboides]
MINEALIIIIIVLLAPGPYQWRPCAADQEELRALVPLKSSFTEFVSWSGTPRNATFNGFSVDVFRNAALRLSVPGPSFSLIPFGDGLSDPSYDDMLLMLEQGKADVVVADITINIDRLKVVDFTQPYMPSALLMITPYRYGRVGTMWDFLQPFSMELWVAILFAFVGTGLVMFTLEYKNPDFHQDQPKLTDLRDDRPPAASTTTVAPNGFKRWANKLVNFYWFTSLTLFFSQQESVMTHAGRFVTVVWLLVVLIFTSSYTASLASTLSAQQPYPTIQGFEFLLKGTAPIGYQGGSFIHNYLTMLGVKEGRLKSLDGEEQYRDALRLGPKMGGVGAIVDEQPYVQSFLSTECEFTIAGDQIAFFGGFGFAFPKNSSLTDKMSLAILSLAQDGTLQRLKDKWVGPSQCNVNAQASSHMKLSSFGGLFIILAAVYGISIVWRVFTWQMKSQTVQARIGLMARVLSGGRARGVIQDQLSNSVMM